MRKKLIPLILLVLLTIGSAQAGIGSYLKDRGADLLDVFLLRVSVARKARGFGARARATALVQAGGIYFEGEHFGMDRRAIGVWKDRRSEGGISLLYFTSVQNDVVWGNYFLRPGTPWMKFEERGIVRNNIYWDDGRKHPLSFNAEIQPGLLPGLEVGIYPTEALDFLSGFLTLDPHNDDMTRVRKYTPVYEEKEIGEEQADLETLPENAEELEKATEPLPDEFSVLEQKEPEYEPAPETEEQAQAPPESEKSMKSSGEEQKKEEEPENKQSDNPEEKTPEKKNNSNKSSSAEPADFITK